MVTSVVYEKSAWIGNLIIPCRQRRKGYGTYLFKSILADLVARDITSVWLTASGQGRSLYEREGFVPVDFIERWVLTPPGSALSSLEDTDKSYEKLLYSDRLAWGERRNSLLPALYKEGKAFAVGKAVAILQAGQDIQVVGPWYSNDASLDTNYELLTMMIGEAEPCVDVVMDLFASSSLRPVCEYSGFECTGQTSLMVYGDIGSINLKSMASLASLGSVG